MSPGEAAASYRLYAAYCAEIAQTVTDSARKVALLDMAQAWARLAELADKDRSSGGANRSPERLTRAWSDALSPRRHHLLSSAFGKQEEGL